MRICGQETPPRMWGRPRAIKNHQRRPRNTPTHVGKTQCPLFGGRPIGKHPHACGEDLSVGMNGHPPKETPPRMWGRPGLWLKNLPPLGNTPTHVGKTEGTCWRATGKQKHPHACGEDSSSSGAVLHQRETPPRMWGRRPRCPQHPRQRRNTPTHVGKTVTVMKAAIQSRKHPHACGEDGAEVEIDTTPWETPPRMWGRLLLLLQTTSGRGNTPTHVGKTINSKCPPVLTQKHPHACGEDPVMPGLASAGLETPPRMWGRPAAERELYGAIGNTPTHVGKTSARSQ
mgnify:CR=1 FL=1